MSEKLFLYKYEQEEPKLKIFVVLTREQLRVMRTLMKGDWLEWAVWPRDQITLDSITVIHND